MPQTDPVGYADGDFKVTLYHFNGLVVRQQPTQAFSADDFSFTPANLGAWFDQPVLQSLMIPFSGSSD